jgi:Lar family restriction alleviation protein
MTTEQYPKLWVSKDLYENAKASFPEYEIILDEMLMEDTWRIGGATPKQSSVIEQVFLKATVNAPLLGSKACLPAVYTPRQALIPCPFCGSKDICVVEGTTFRWRLAQCNDCGAQAGEVRIQTSGDGTSDKWEALAEKDAIAEWNTRHKQERQERRHEEQREAEELAIAECEHEWDTLIDSQFNNEQVEDVRCHKCSCYGERTRQTGEVFWPAT